VISGPFSGTGVPYNYIGYAIQRTSPTSPSSVTFVANSSGEIVASYEIVTSTNRLNIAATIGLDSTPNTTYQAQGSTIDINGLTNDYLSAWTYASDSWGSPTITAAGITTWASTTTSVGQLDQGGSVACAIFSRVATAGIATAGPVFDATLGTNDTGGTLFLRLREIPPVFVDISDASSVTDSAAPTRTIGASGSDTIATTDSAFYIQNSGRLPSDLLNIDDSVSLVQDRILAVDPLSTTDTVSKSSYWAQTDSIATTDSVTTQVKYVFSTVVNDTITATDAFTPSYIRLPTDAPALTDSTLTEKFNTYAPILSDTIDISEDYYRGLAITLNLSESVQITDLGTYLFGIIPVLSTGIGVRSIRADFQTVMVDTSDLVNPTQYTLVDLSGNAISVTGVKKFPSVNPTYVVITLASDLTSGKPYELSISGKIQSIAGRNPSPSTFIWTKPKGNFKIPISKFSGEVRGGLFGDHNGLVFFSPALTQAVAQSAIEVDDVKVCTTAYDTYTIPPFIDPPVLFTYFKGGPMNQTSLIGSAAVFGSWNRLSEARTDLKYKAPASDTIPPPGNSPSTLTTTLLAPEGVSGDTSFGLTYSWTEGQATRTFSGLVVQSALALSEQLLAALQKDLYQVSGSDAADFLDSIFNSASFGSLPATDVADLTESVQIEKNNTLKQPTIATDAIVMTDTASYLKTFGLILSDDSTATDTVTTNGEFLRAVADTWIGTDSVISSATRSRTLSDSMASSDLGLISPIIKTIDTAFVDSDNISTPAYPAITLTGFGFASVITVTVGGAAGTILTGQSTDNVIQFYPPAKPAGVYNVVVTTVAGSSNTVSLEYWDPSLISGQVAYLDSRKQVISTGGLVTSWAPSGAGGFQRQTISTSPSLITNSFKDANGNDVQGVRFGGSHYLVGSPILITGSKTVFWVSKWVGGTIQPYGNSGITNVLMGSNLGYGPNFGGSGYGADPYNDFGTNGAFAACTVQSLPVDTTQRSGSSLYSGDTVGDNRPHLVGVSNFNQGADPTVPNGIQGAPAAVAFYVGGSPSYPSVITSSDYAQGSGSVSFDTIGAEGTGRGHAHGWQGDVGAVLIVNGLINSSDRVKLYTWAKQNFGVV
jgi:hypothetical protein